MRENKNKRIVVIGGVAAGTKAAAKARRQDPNAEITIYTNEKYISYAGCGQPYYIGGEIAAKDALLARTPEQFQQASRINVHTSHKAVRIDPHAKTVEILDLNSNQSFTASYDALVIATGASPIIPPLPGFDLPGVYAVRTVPDAEAMRSMLDSGKVKEAVVVGGGYIGLEMVENLVAQNVKVTVVEREPQLAPLFDEEVAAHIRNALRHNGVDIITGSSLESIQGSREYGVKSVMVGGREIPADLVILSIGIRPNVQLAKEAGIELGSTGAIRVNERLQTNFPDIYAGGDCTESIQLVTGKPTWVPLGSTANKQGRVIGINATGGDAVFPGVLGTGIFRVFDLNVARTGLIEKELKAEGIDYEAAIVAMDDKPHYMAGLQKVIIKLLAEKSSRRLIGAEVWGRGKVDKVVDTLATVLYFKGTVDDAMQLDLAYAPPFAPALGNVITAANVLQNKLDKNTEGILPMDVKKKIDLGDDDFVFVDVRPPEMRDQLCSMKDCLFIPMPTLKQNLERLPKDKMVITSCLIGMTAAQAYRVLKQNGFPNVRYMDGGVTAWPDPVPNPDKK
ncbi:MAG: FAD-dependent oxidoreductase [Candidatus Omnitrophica bacterium]|nr:FAD-dependent oxidoreductase [Candidatus Omnitrophota bacterium]